MTATTHPASAPAPTSAEVPAPTAPIAEQPQTADARRMALPRNLARLTAQAEEAGWTAAVQTQPGHCALLLTARQEAGETVLRCVWRLTARGYRWDGATLTRYGQTAAQGIAWRAVAGLVAADAPTARTQPTTAETSAPRGRARKAPSVAEVERARRAAEEWPEAMQARSLGDRYEGEFRRSDLLSDLSVCSERFPFRFHFRSGGGHTVTLPMGDVRGTWGEVTGAAIAYVIAERPASVLRATAETARVYDIHAELAAQRAEESTQTAVSVGMARAALDTVRAFAQRIDWDKLTDEQYDSARDAVREAEQCAEGAESAYGRGDVDTARWEARDALAAARWFGLDVPSAQECAERAPEPRAVAGRVRPHASAFLLRITRPGWEEPADTVKVPAGDAPTGSGVTPDVATSEERDADAPKRVLGEAPEAADAGPAEGAPVVAERPAVLPDVVSDPGGVDGWEADGGAVEVLPVICHGKGGGVFPVAFRGPYEGTVRVSRAWLTERARRALTVARERLTAEEEHAETCAAWRRDAYDLHQEARRSAGVLGPDVWVASETAGAWSARAREASWDADKRRQGARDVVRWRERELSALESEAREAGERAAAGRNFLARAAAGDIPAGRGAWAAADGGAAVMFELPACAEVSPDMEHTPGMAERRAFVDLLADAVSARDEGRALIGRDLPTNKTHGRTGGIEKGQASASAKALVQPWKAPKIPAAGKAPTAAQLEDWQDGYAGAPVVAETEAAPGVWLPMAAVAFAETATANGWTVAMQRQGATVTVRAGGRATGKVPGEVRAVWSAGLYDVTASGAWVDGVRLDTAATLHAVNATVAQQCKAPGALAEDARPDAHADAVDLDGWEGEGGALARDGGELPPPAQGRRDFEASPYWDARHAEERAGSRREADEAGRQGTATARAEREASGTGTEERAVAVERQPDAQARATGAAHPADTTI
ncbi:hypothetical protein [Streptomyces sp. NPDC091217]|uniref:hypothetical protein n=1 Tax=Streptomyces sp. NPDC091217 TaxID=3365975 RepID=UPI003805B08B